MKIFKGLVLLSILFCLVGCKDKVTVEIQKESNLITLSVFSDFDLDDYIYGIDSDGQRINCEFSEGNININVVGEYEVTCIVSLDNGEEVSEEINIEVIDDIDPIISLSDSHTSEFPINSTIDFYAGVNASDNYDQLVDIVIDDSAVDYSSTGNYNVVYTVTDDSGNHTELVVSYELVSYEVPILIYEAVNTSYESVNLIYEVTDIDNTLVSIVMNVYDDTFRVFSETKTNLDDVFTIDNLFSDKMYDIQLVMYYSLNNGENVDEYINVIHHVTQPKIIPEVTLSPGQSGSNYLKINVNITDIDETITTMELIVYDGSTEVDSIIVTESGLYEFYNLLSDHYYNVEMNYYYDLNDESGDISGISSTYNITRKNIIPEITLISGEPTISTYYLQFEINDLSYTVVNCNILLLSDDDELLSTIPISKSTSEYLFEDLIYGTHYQAIVSVEYDLNDGQGIQTIESTQDIYTDMFGIISLTVVSPILFEGNDLVFTVVVDDPYNWAVYHGIVVNGYSLSMTEIGDDTFRVIFPCEYLEFGLNTITVESFSRTGTGGEYYLPVHGNNSFEILYIQ